MNWFVTQLTKEARDRRFTANDRVRYFTEQRKGKGKGVILTPSFTKGTVVDYNNKERRYKVKNDKDEIIDVHPRNLIPDSFVRSPVNSVPEALPTTVDSVVPTVEEVAPFPR